MGIRWLLAALHLLALGIGLGAIWARRRALLGPLDPAGLSRVFYADAWWGASAGLWIGTGVLRAFAGFEKGADYYLQNPLFLAKMGCLVAILILEAGPMTGLIRWRRELGRGTVPDTGRAAAYATASLLQAGLLALMVVLATGMARGVGAASP
jgi:putative membrane protein